MFGSTHLRLGGFNICATFECLFERVVKRKIRSSQEWNVVGEIVFVAWRQSGHSGQNDLLLCHFVFKRDDPLLLC